MGSKYVRVWLLAASALVIAVLLGACSGGDSDSSKFPIDLTGSRVAAGEEIYAQNCDRATARCRVLLCWRRRYMVMRATPGTTRTVCFISGFSIAHRLPRSCWRSGASSPTNRCSKCSPTSKARGFPRYRNARTPELKAVRGPGHRRRDRTTVKYLRAPRLVQQYWPGQEAPCVRPESWTP